MENPDDEFDVEKDWPVVTQEEYDANPSGYRDICWDLKVSNVYAFHYIYKLKHVFLYIQM